MLMEKFLTEDPRFTIKDNIITGSSPNKEETRNFAQLILDSLSGHPDFIAQIKASTGQTTTFSDVKDRSTRCALWLGKQGVCEDDVIGIMTHNQQDDFIPFLSTAFINAIYSPWFHNITATTARRYFQICRPKIMFASEQSIDMLAKAAEEAGVDCKFVLYGTHSTFSSLNSLMAQQSEEEVKNFKYVAAKVPGKKVGMVFFSSGTTGDSKATMLPYDCLLQHVPERTASNKIADYWLWYSSLAWITGTIYVAFMIQWRFTRIMHAEFEPNKTSQIIQKYKINVVVENPTMLTQCYKADAFTNYDYSSVKLMITTGSTISTKILEECRKLLPQTFIGNCFGMTEAGQFVTRQTKRCKGFHSIGFVCEDIAIKVIDVNTGNALGPNQQGEICFKTDRGMLGYMKDEQATKKVIDEDVSPAAIESILLEHPAVAKCAVVPVAHSVDIERPFAFVVKVPRVQVTAEELIELPAIRNKYYKLSGGLVFIDDLMYTSSGKISIKQMKDKAEAYAS